MNEFSEVDEVELEVCEACGGSLVKTDEGHTCRDCGTVFTKEG